MKTIEEMRKELADKAIQKKTEIDELIAITRVKHEMVKLDSPLFNDREMTKIDTLNLDVIIQTITEQYTVDDRKMSMVYGYGIIPNKILAIMKAIQFSKAEEKTELLMITGLDEQIIEDTLDAFGNTAYFSKANVEVVPEIPMDIPKVKELLKVVALDMGLVSEVDLSRFNTANVDYQYTRARLRAEDILLNTKLYLSEATTYTE